jgi:hypothetical protein
VDYVSTRAAAHGGVGRRAAGGRDMADGTHGASGDADYFKSVYAPSSSPYVAGVVADGTDGAMASSSDEECFDGLEDFAGAAGMSPEGGGAGWGERLADPELNLSKEDIVSFARQFPAEVPHDVNHAHGSSHIREVLTSRRRPSSSGRASAGTSTTPRSSTPSSSAGTPSPARRYRVIRATPVAFITVAMY